MDSRSMYERIGSPRVVPVIAIEGVESALPLAGALLEGGLPVAEITFRTKAASARCSGQERLTSDFLDF